ncbi:hypothetical protein HMPREF0731_0692 [Pseudoroseomonas cervicalis ATCC 49957]|uniref:Uncharacterized protein n=1 Tax=Pseudoroseomonas cervicalis ATCC 49957 TaxID=525371 RepID=D5RHY2_9PROT|nr:hypothetical protein HMPREF0731_0692 [Pseudoroseomonas cervicalis ATCC 49957]
MLLFLQKKKILPGLLPLERLPWNGLCRPPHAGTPGGRRARVRAWA